VGDLQQPRGGPMLTGHASHQLGLDADIWLTPMPDRTLTRRERETMSATLMTRSKYKINETRWTEAHSKLIKRAASYKEVERIFVHPPIKKAICDWAGNKGSWLAKIRPLYGHNYHFHIRMACPPGSPRCKPQGKPKPVDGTGCGQELADWYARDKARIEARKRAKKKPKPKTEVASKNKHKTVNGIPIPRPKPGPSKPAKPKKNLAWLPKECRALVQIQ
jgi:penicillin-insensitive murein endopeptidase